jgi:hypothetical protein
MRIVGHGDLRVIVEGRLRFPAVLITLQFGLIG